MQFTTFTGDNLTFVRSNSQPLTRPFPDPSGPITIETIPSSRERIFPPAPPAPEAVSEVAVSEVAVSGEAVSEVAVSEVAVSGEAVSGEAVSGEAVSGDHM